MKRMTYNQLYSIAVRMMDLQCSECGRVAVRMWRLPHMTQVKCAACSVAEQAEELEQYRSIGVPDMWPDGHLIGDRLPAVVDADGSMWGLTSIPPQAFALWRSLPDNAPLEQASS